jgi:vacuolar-type H+-ATPase subunit F/Vma7
LPHLIVVTTAELAPGFRLAGAAVRVARSAPAAADVICRLIDEGETGVIGVHEPFLAGLAPSLRRRLEEMPSPVIVALPPGTVGGDLRRRRERLADLLRRAVGWHMTFRATEGGGS